MANNKKVKQNRIERKYSKIIAKTLKEYKDRTMQELWAELDRIKAELKEELDAIQ